MEGEDSWRMITFLFMKVIFEFIIVCMMINIFVLRERLQKEDAAFPV